MPLQGQVNNPSGINGLNDEGVQTPYGQIKQLTEATKAVPLPPNQALNAPRRAGRAVAAPPSRARTQQAPPPSSFPVVVPAQPLPMTPEQQIAALWQEAAAQPGASDLVKRYAAQTAGVS